VLSNEADVGVLIHENRFTYANRGLKLIMDLGEFWEQTTGMPIPLGGIVVSRQIPEEKQILIQELIHNSLVFAHENPGSALQYMKSYAQDMRDEIMLQHVDTFVNEFSLSLGEDGKKAVCKLLEIGSKKGLFPVPGDDVFV
jgi:1,4-dihydroxy-6-naphthoate synthase